MEVVKPLDPVRFVEITNLFLNNLTRPDIEGINRLVAYKLLSWEVVVRMRSIKSVDDPMRWTWLEEPRRARWVSKRRILSILKNGSPSTGWRWRGSCCVHVRRI
jgi:hypothetical protein